MQYFRNHRSFVIVLTILVLGSFSLGWIWNEVTCTHCSGTGKIAQLCGVCKGTGRTNFGTLKCPACGGTGAVTIICQTCRGSGKVPKK